MVYMELPQRPLGGLANSRPKNDSSKSGAIKSKGPSDTTTYFLRFKSLNLKKKVEKFANVKSQIQKMAAKKSYMIAFFNRHF